HSWPSEFKINNAVRRNDAVFIFHVLARAKIDSSTGVFNQEPAGCDVPQADSALNVSVQAAGGDIGQVERRAGEHSAFTHAMDHLLEQRKICVDRLGGFGEPNGNDGLSEICAIAYVESLAIQFWNLAFLSFPHLSTNGVVYNTNHDLIPEAQCNRDAKMWNAVEIIHGAIQRIDDPLVFARLISHNSFYSVKRVLGKLFEKEFANQFLHLNVDLELNVVCCDSINPLWLPKIFPKQLAGRARSLFSCIEVMFHDVRQIELRSRSAKQLVVAGGVLRR